VTQCDAVIVGGGHNAMVTAALLARAKWKVVVLERRHVLGGAASTAEIFPGCRVNVAAQDAGLFSRDVALDLGLHRHGLEWIEPPIAATSLIGDGEALALWRDPARTQDEIARYARADAARFPAWADHLSAMSRALRVVLAHPAPALHDLTGRERLRLLRPLLQARRLGKHTLVELLRTVSLPARDLLDDWFGNDVLKAALATVTRRIGRPAARIDAVIAADPGLARRRDILTIVPGIGPVTAAALICRMPEPGATPAA